MKKLKLAVDIDDVVAEFVPYFIERFNAKMRTNYNINDIKSYDLGYWINVPQEEIFKMTQQMQVNREYEKLKPVEGVLEHLAKLNSDGHTIDFITARTNATSTLRWLKEHQIGFNELFMGADKITLLKILRPDVYIEDNSQYLLKQTGAGLKIVYSKPWNTNIKRTSNLIVATSWKQIYKICTDYARNEQ